MDDLDSIGCGFVQGFHLHTIVPAIVERRPQQRGEWLLPGEPPVKGQLVKVQVNTDSAAWGILTGRITEIEDGYVVIGSAERTTDDEAIPGGPYRLTLRYDETMEFPWVLSRAELC